MRKANAGHYEGKSKTADWWARFIALPSLIVSVLMFYHGYVTPGELKFTRPNICHIAQWADNRERLVVVIPVVVTNTGAVVHTVSYLTGRLTFEAGNEGWTDDCDMCVQSDRMPLPTSGNANALPFCVAPRSSNGKVVAFASRKNHPTIKPGKYGFALYAYEDGTTHRVMTDVGFTLELTQDEASTVQSGGVVPRYQLYLR